MGNSTRRPDKRTINDYKFPDPILSPPMNLQPRGADVFGLFETVSAAPTATPINWINQVKIYVNGATLRLYWYDATNATWHYVTATA